MRLTAILAATLLAAAGCATDDPAKVRVLESDQRALEVRLDKLQRTGERDLRLRDLRQRAARHLESLSDEESVGPFLVVRRAWFQAMLEAMTPLETSVGGFRWRFTDPKVRIENEGVLVDLRFAVLSPRLKKQLGRPANGTLVGSLEALASSDGAVAITYLPLELTVDDADFRAATALKRKVRLDDFDGLVPGFSVPLLPASGVECCEGRSVQLTARFDPDLAVAVPSGLLVPFTLERGAKDVPPEPEPEPEPE